MLAPFPPQLLNPLPLPTVENVLFFGTIFFGLRAVYLGLQYMIRSAFDNPLRCLQGPSGGWWLFGHLPQVLDPDETPKNHEDFVAQYGRTFRHYGYGFWDVRIFSIDPAVIRHVLTNMRIYDKGWHAKAFVDGAVGVDGLTMAEGSIHKRLRNCLRGVFAASESDATGPMARLKARELVDKWTSMIAAEPSGRIKVDVSTWLSRVAFDVIGLAGFSYDFNAIHHQDDVLYKTFQDLISTVSGISFRSLLAIHFPWLDKYIRNKRQDLIDRCQAVIHKMALQWIEDRKAEYRGEKTCERPDVCFQRRNEIKDLLTRMVEGVLNPDPEIPFEDRLTTENMIAQISTFMLAGTDTVGLTLSWYLHHLATHPGFQSALRAELLAMDADASYGEIDGAPLMGAGTRETIRKCPILHSILRCTTAEDVLRLSEEVTLTDGTTTNKLVVPKGTFIHIPLEGFNTLKAFWGDDAHEFRPERWFDLPDTVPSIGSLYSNLMTFSAGPKACIGANFALREVKVVMFELVRNFEFAPAAKKIVRRNVMLTRPIVDGENDKGPQLPLLISRYVPPPEPHTVPLPPSRPSSPVPF